MRAVHPVKPEHPVCVACGKPCRTQEQNIGFEDVPELAWTSDCCWADVREPTAEEWETM